MLFQVYEETYDSEGGSLPSASRTSRMVFLPTGDEPNDQGSFVTRAPGATRPLSLSNTDAKVWSDAFCADLNDVAPHTVMERQRGGVRGRNILNDVVEVE